MSGEPTRWCSYGQHRVYVVDFRDDTRAICQACHRARERDSRGDHTRRRELKRRWKYLIHYAHDRARKQGLPFDLLDHQDEIKRRVESGRCELSGLPFNTTPEGRSWNSPSIDKIKPELGYVLTNVRIVLYGLNFAMSNWGEDVLRQMTEYMRRD